MNLRRILARNAFWTAAMMACGVVTGFLTAPFLIHRLGQTTYGMWILIMSFTSYLNLVDLGLRSSITRHVAFLRAKKDYAAVNATLSTAQALLTLAALVALGVTFVLVAFSTRLFDVAPDQAADVRMALMLAGTTVALTLAMSIFDATLWAYERLDLLNGIDIPVDVAQTVTIFYFIGHGGTLVALASIILVGTVCGEVAKAVLCFGLDRRLRINPACASISAARQLFGFGLWKFAWSMGTRATSQCGPIVLRSAGLAAASSTHYSVAARLIGYGRSFCTVGTGVLTPTATVLHAEQNHLPQRRLFLEGGKYCFALSLFFVTLIVSLAKPFVVLWIGTALASASAVATILALGEILPMSQWATCSILLARDRHRVMACASLVETVAVFGLGSLAARRFGLEGVSIVIAVTGTLSRGILPIVYGCRLLDVSLLQYVRGALLPPVVAAAVPALGLAILVHRHTPSSWPELILVGGIFSLTSCFTFSALIGYKRLRGMAARFRPEIGIPVPIEPGATL